MDKLNYTFQFTHVPPGFKRGSLAILAIFQDGKLILSRKHAYPDEVYRLLGGGIDRDELPHDAALRELAEETSLNLPKDKLNHQATFVFDLLELSTDNTYLFQIELFVIQLNNEKLIPSDDIDIISSFTTEQAKQKISLMNQLSEELVSPKKDLNAFRWSDWGTVFSTVHQYVIDHWQN